MTQSQAHPGNLIDHIHNEAYETQYNLQNLNHTTMMFATNRPSEQLNGEWSFTVDAYDMGRRSRWYKLDQTDAQGNPLPWNYRPEDGEIVPVPSCWNMVNAQHLYYEGTAWYARQFSYTPDHDDERVFLRMGAANYDAGVILNEEFLGNHYGGSTPFFVEVTDHLKAQNQILIYANNDRRLDRVPMRNTDWYNYGGLYRDVELIRVPADFIKTFQMYLTPNGQFNEMTVKIAVSDANADDEVQVRIPDLGIEQSAPLTDGAAEVTFRAKPELWSPENPKLYQVEACFRNDTIHDRIGFREIRVDGTQIVLNGKPLFLRGISVHEDDWEMGKATCLEDLLQRFEHAKELGCNFMRLAHYPHHELAAQLADVVGILLWEEVPVYWAIAFENTPTYEDAENQLLELIQRDFNRASVIIWSVGNENADTDARFKFMSELAKKAKSVDGSRLVSAACLVNKAALKIEDRLTAALDVIGLNEYYGWYEPNYDELVQLGQNSQPDKPVIITETGAGALAGHHGTKSDMFTEEHMEHVYERQIEVIRTLDYVQGMSPWILYDFRTPHRCNRFQRGWNRKGLIADDKRTKKLAFYVLQRFYQELAQEG
jgi:beta-glucuronidase